MALRELSYPSFNERDTIKAWVYVPIRKPKAIVQVVHGLGEHSRRYLHLIISLNEAGFVVCADDHVGHGKTAFDSNTWGDFGDRGYATTIEDEKSLYEIVAKDFPNLPFVMFGHSWGSMIARGFAASYGTLLAGLVICGTCGLIDGIEQIAQKLETQLGLGLGNERDPEFLKQIFSSWTSRYDKVQSPNDWISGDPDVVADHAADPFNNLYAAMTNQSMYDFADLILNITGTKWAEKLPEKLPIYNIAGDQDPVGNYGEGVYTVSNWLANTGHRKVSTKLYSGHRHEIHNDRDIRDLVEHGIIAFIDRIV